MHLPAAGLALALLLVPAALAADQGSLTFSPDFTTLTATLEMGVTGAEAADMRAAMDQYGDQDGQATQAEADRFAQDFRGLIGSSVDDMAEGDNLTLDGARPTSMDLADLSFSNVAGPVTSTERVGMHMVLRIGMRPAPGDSHTLFMRGEKAEGDGTVQMTITAPAGYIIASYTGIPGATQSADRSTLTFTDSAGNDQDGTVVFARPSAAGTGTKGSPAPALALAAVALAMAALARRS
jgi:hypothetical protein